MLAVLLLHFVLLFCACVIWVCIIIVSVRFLFLFRKIAAQWTWLFKNVVINKTQIFYPSMSIVYQASPSWPFRFSLFEINIPPYPSTCSLSATQLRHTHTHTHSQALVHSLTLDPNAESATLHSYAFFFYFEISKHSNPVDFILSPISYIYAFLYCDANELWNLKKKIRRQTEGHGYAGANRNAIRIAWFSFRFPHN